jgi:hypothetical protein
MHLRPKADQFMREVKRLRAQRASREKCEGAADVLYPPGSAAASSLKSMRSRFLRACLASDESFQQGEEAYGAGGNVVQIVAGLDKTSTAGAPKGNLNAQGKKRDLSLDRINGMWRSMSPAKQEEFLRMHKLSRVL